MMKKAFILTCIFLWAGWALAQVQNPRSVNPSRTVRSIKPLEERPRFPVAGQGKVETSQPFGAHMFPARGGHSSQDGRNLPLNHAGKLLSPNGEEVDFVIPRHAYTQGGCATPVPVVRGSGAARANCPIESPCDVAATRNANIPTAGQATKWIKLRWTVVLNGNPASNITQTDINLLMAELRADYQPFGFDFCADPAQFVNNTTYYNLDVNTEDAGLKTTYGANFTQVLNVYVVNNISLSPTSGAGGYARFPYDPLGGTSPRGGVVLAQTNARTGTHTLAHEIGHAFGLHHTFRGVDEVPTCSNCYERVSAANGSAANGDTEGDWCSDTNPHPVNTFNCFDPAGPANACDAFTWNNTPVNNHMSYSFCTTTFTNQQAGRMHCMVNRYLSAWTTFGGPSCGSQPPVADFSGNPTRYQAPATVVFTDQSQPPSLITTWNWDFDLANLGGVTPGTFTGQNPPSVVYTNPGIYTVRLIVSNANGSDTLIRTNYIEVVAPAADCDTLFQKFATPFPTLAAYQWSANDYLTGVPNTQNEYGYYERYFTPTPGTTTVGAVFVGLTGFLDADSSMLLDFVVYNDDGTGEPFIAQGPIGGLFGLEPGGDIGVPPAPFYTEIWIPFFTPVRVDSPRFHVGVEVRNNGAADRIQVLSSSVGQGQLNGDNHLVANRATPAVSNYLTDVSVPGFTIDFDLEIIPMLGEWPAVPVVSFFDTAGCDTTLAVLLDTFFYSSTLTNISFDFDSLGVVSGDTVADVATIFVRYTQPGPDTFVVSYINSCGRGDSVRYVIDYDYNQSPAADFAMNTPNPVCKDSTVSFLGSPPGAAIQTYAWDFGDGTTTSGGNNLVTHSYTTPGIYYVSLTVTDTATCTDTEQKLGFVEVIDCAVVPPATGFSISPTTGCDFEQFTFTDTTPTTPNPPTSWLWDFGDGSFSTAQNPTHTYTMAGTYTVRLVASNAGGSVVQTSTLVVNACPQSLDVNLRGALAGQGVRLDWEQKVEAPARQYRVQRSLDGTAFEEIDHLLANGPGTYVAWDHQPPQADVLFYRLAVTEADGSTARSNTVAVSLSGESSLWLTAQPNPVQAGEFLRIQAYVPQSGLYLTLMDAGGRNVGEMKLPQARGVQELAFPLEGLAPGLYFLQGRDDRGQQKGIKVLVQ